MFVDGSVYITGSCAQHRCPSVRGQRIYREETLMNSVLTEGDRGQRDADTF